MHLLVITMGEQWFNSPISVYNISCRLFNGLNLLLDCRMKKFEPSKLKVTKIISSRAHGKLRKLYVKM